MEAVNASASPPTGCVHSVPINDVREHRMTPDCWCRPTQDEDYERLWHHHALDQRDTYERGRKMH